MKRKKFFLVMLTQDVDWGEGGQLNIQKKKKKNQKCLKLYENDPG